MAPLPYSTRFFTGITVCAALLSACSPDKPETPAPLTFDPISIEVELAGTSQPEFVATHLEDRLSHGAVRQIESVMVIRSTTAELTTDDASWTGCITDISVPTARHFGDDGTSGLDELTSLTGSDRLAITQPIADELHLHPSSSVKVSVPGIAATQFTVDRIVGVGTVTSHCPVVASEGFLAPVSAASTKLWIQLGKSTRSDAQQRREAIDGIDQQAQRLGISGIRSLDVVGG